jgi:DNA-binding NtrC family response regulator
MIPNLLVIENASHNVEQSVALQLTSTGEFRCEQKSWDALDFDRLRSHSCELVLPVTASANGGGTAFFQWLRKNPLRVPTLAVLHGDSNEDLIRSASQVTDDFALSPVSQVELQERLKRLLGPPVSNLNEIHKGLREKLALAQIIGNDQAVLQIIAQLPSIAASDVPILITGETGTGKELCARAIHMLSKRSGGPFIPVDCGVIPDHLAENELFGHSRGAFTDAHADQKGLISMADEGTLFVDEIDGLSQVTQAKFLRFFQESTYRPLGSDKFSRANVRIIAATNRNLEELVGSKQFRSDLYFRLNVLRLHLPPLRERRGDIERMARHFVKSLSGPEACKSISPAAIRKLETYDWPGNVRELINLLQRANVHSGETQSILPCHIMLPELRETANDQETSFQHERRRTIESFEQRFVTDLLRKHNGNVTHAAQKAGKDRRDFGRLIKKYGIRRDRF